MPLYQQPGQMPPPPMQQQQAPPQQQQQIPPQTPVQAGPAANQQLVPSQSRIAGFPPSSKRSVGLNDFNFLSVLGKGNFGKVMLAEEIRTGSLYAIKVLKKEFIIENDEVER